MTHSNIHSLLKPDNLVRPKARRLIAYSGTVHPLHSFFTHIILTPIATDSPGLDLFLLTYALHGYNLASLVHAHLVFVCYTVLQLYQLIATTEHIS